MPKVSVIIPVYNAEEYLRECLDSIVNQTLQDLEIICVDDGSTDNSLEILKEYAQKDNRCIILEQENKGAGAARNKGLGIASGEYLHFMDADDYVISDTLYEEIYNQLYELNYPNIIRFQAQAVDYCNKNILPKAYKFKSMGLKDINTYLRTKDSIELTVKLSPTPWLGFIKKDFVIDNCLVFSNLKVCNDRSFFIESCLSTDEIYLSDMIVVCHRVNNKCSLKGIRDRHYSCMYTSINLIRTFMKERNIPEYVQKFVMISELQDLFNCFKRYIYKSEYSYTIYKTIIEFLENFNYKQYLPEIANANYYNLMEYLSSKQGKTSYIDYLFEERINHFSVHPMKNFISNIFSVRNINGRKVVTIFGLKLKLKSKKLMQRQKIESIESKIYNCEKTLECLQDDIRSYLKQQDCDKKAYVINSDYEAARCKDFYDEIDKDDYIQKYKNLIRNLDSESTNCVCKVLSRVKLAANKNMPLDILTDKEKAALKTLKNEFYPNILKLTDNCYAYDQYLLPQKHFEPSVFYYKYSIDSLNNLYEIRNKNIIDAGGYIGDSAIVLKNYTDKHVFSFEPTTVNFELLLKTIDYNDCKDKIIPVKQALGGCEQDLEINIQSSGSSINRIVQENPAKEMIHVSTLDKFVEEHKIDIGLIKVDIEGYEQEFIKGALNTIQTQKPVLLLSIYHFADDFFNIKPMIEAMNLGYSFRIVKPVDGSIRGEILLICEQ